LVLQLAESRTQDRRGQLHPLPRETAQQGADWRPLAWIIHDFAGEKRKGALKD
jgi:hypothetical protein